MSDDRELLPQEDGKLREIRAGSVNVGVFAFKNDVISTLSEKWNGPEPYVWDQLLLDAQALWPNLGSSIVTAYSALETFIAWALDILQSMNHALSDEGWDWLKCRGNFLKDPSVEEQYDTLLSILGARSLKSEEKLWTSFKELKNARNSLVHEGVAKIRKGTTPIDALKAKSLIGDAEKIIEWVENYLPEASRRHSRGLTNQATRRFATKEEANRYQLQNLIENGESGSTTQSTSPD